MFQSYQPSGEQSTSGSHPLEQHGATTYSKNHTHGSEDNRGEANQGGPPGADHSTTSTLFPNVGSTSYTSGNDANSPGIPLDTLSPSGQAPPRASHCYHEHDCSHSHHAHEHENQASTLLPNAGSTSSTSGNDANSPEIPLDALSPTGQAQHHASHCWHGHDCSHSHHSHEHGFSVDEHTSETYNRDVENEAALDRVIVLVFGTHCTNCADEVQRALRNIRGVHHPNVNFLQGKVDFLVDKSSNPTQEVLRVLRQKKLDPILASDNYHHIDIVLPQSLVGSVEEQKFPGVVEIEALSKSSARFQYDPSETGARTLFGRLKQYSQGVELAPLEDDPAISHAKKCRKEKLIQLCLAALLALPVAILNMGNIPIDEKRKAVVSLVLASLVQLIAIPEFYQPAVMLLYRYRNFEMDMLVVVSISAAYVYSVTAFGHLMARKPLEEKAFFETSALLIAFVLLGRFIATYARTYAVEKVSFRSLQPTTAIVIENGQDREIDSRLLQKDDKFKVLPDTKFPTDGIVVEGMGEVNESMLTGESLPVLKSPGSTVSAGTINGTATLIVYLSRLPGKNTVTDIAGQVEEASKSKPKVQELADRIAKWIVTGVVVFATSVFVGWLLVELKSRHSGTGRAIARAMTYAVAVLAVSCPCALGLAVPMVIVVAGGLAAKAGVVIKASHATVYAWKVTDVVFDKTGTITLPTLQVERHHTFSYSEQAVFPIAKALVQDNKHPISVAVNKYLEEQGVEAAQVTDKHAHPGQGVVANFQGAVVKAGSPQWTLSDSEPDVKGLIDDGSTVLSVASDDVPIVCFALSSRLQPDAVEVVKDLIRRGITVHMVSGDQDAAVKAAAREAGIPDDNVASRCSLEQKVEYVTRLQTEKKKRVMFCGDGANDAGAVSAADVGVHVGGSLSSSDITCEAANVVLLNGLKGIPYLLDLSQSAYRRIQFNFAWTFIYNLTAILLASGAFVVVRKSARIPPQYAGLGELVSVLPVIIAGGTMFFSRSVRSKSSWLAAGVVGLYSCSRNAFRVYLRQ